MTGFLDTLAWDQASRVARHHIHNAGIALYDDLSDRAALEYPHHVVDLGAALRSANQRTEARELLRQRASTLNQTAERQIDERPDHDHLRNQGTPKLQPSVATPLSDREPSFLNPRAAATVLAVEHDGPAVYNIVDDEPSPTCEWLPELARILGAKPPRRAPAWLARLLAGEAAVMMGTEARGASNARAKRELGWTLRYPTWRQGFLALDAKPTEEP